MKKLMIFLLVGIFMISCVSAFEFDNVKRYDPSDKIAKVKNTFGIGGDIANIKLLSPLEVRVPIGYRKVAEIELEYFKDKNGGLDKLEFFDINNGMRKVERQIDYKIWDEKNNRWKDFKMKDLKKKKKVRVGLFTEVKSGDKIEWIPTYFGVKIEEWAVWTADLNVGLQHYYKLDETSGVIAEDSVGTQNGTANSPRVFNASSPGANGTSANFLGDDDYITIGDIDWIDSAWNLTVSLWANISSFAARGTYIGKTDTGAADDAVFIIENVDATEMRFTIRSVNDTTQLLLIDPDDNLLTTAFQHIVLLVNQTDMSVYINGTLINSSARTDYAPFNNNSKNLSIGRYGSALNFYYHDMAGRTIDEVAIWNRSLSPAEINGLSNDGLAPSYLDFDCSYGYNNVNTSIQCNTSTVFPTITSPTGTYDYNYVGGTLPLNYTDGVTNFTTDITLDTPTNLTFYFTNSSGNFSQVVNWTNRILDTNTDFSDGFEFESTTISNNVTANTSLSSATLTWNGTNYSTTRTNLGGGAYNFASTFDIPPLSGTQANFTFKYLYAGAFIDGREQTQNVSTLVFDECNSTLNRTFVNFYAEDETDLSSINFTMDATFNFRVGASTTSKNFSISNSTEASNYSFCSNFDDTLTVDATVNIDSAGYHERTFFFNNQNYSNSSIVNHTLLLLNDTIGTSVIVQVTDPGLVPLEGVITNVYRYYPGTNEYLIVERAITDEFGQFVSRLIEPNTVKYQFEFMASNGSVLKRTGDIAIACRATICVIPFVIEDTTDEFERFDNITSFDYSLSFDNATNIFTYTWNDNTGDSITSRLLVEKIQFNGTITVCNVTSTSVASSLTCNVTSNGDGTYRAQAFRQANGENEGRVTLLDIEIGGISATIGLEGLFWGMILTLTLVAVGAFNPTVGIVLYIAGFVGLGSLGIISMSVPMFFAQVVIGVLFIWAIRS